MNGEPVGPLRRDAIGLREVLFQSITATAPAAAVAVSVPSGAAFAGDCLPPAVPAPSRPARCTSPTTAPRKGAEPR